MKHISQTERIARLEAALNTRTRVSVVLFSPGDSVAALVQQAFDAGRIEPGASLLALPRDAESIEQWAAMVAASPPLPMPSDVALLRPATVDAAPRPAARAAPESPRPQVTQRPMYSTKRT